MKYQTMKKTIFSCLITALSISFSAQAVMPLAQAEKMDENGDQKITTEEYAAFYDSDYKRRDRGDDGVLTPKEFTNKN